MVALRVLEITKYSLIKVKHQILVTYKFLMVVQQQMVAKTLPLKTVRSLDRLLQELQQ